MSYITFDYQCPDGCPVDTRLVKREETDNQWCPKHSCPKPMNRLPAGPRTTFKFNDKKLKD